MRFPEIKRIFNCESIHIEPVTKDNGASKYAMKEETRIEGPKEFGIKK